MMTYVTKIRKEIDSMKSGAVITAGLFPNSWPRNTVNRVLARLNQDGLIKRLKRGVYTKTKKTRFGDVTASALEVIANEIKHDDNKCFGGVFLFNNLGLTTQVPKVIEILNNKSSYVQDIKRIKVRYVRIRPKIGLDTKPYIIFLEVLKNIKAIPDSYSDDTYKWVTTKLDSFEIKELRKLSKISFDYPPRVRALLGCLLYSKSRNLATKIMSTLNSNTSYEVGSIVKYLNNSTEWRLKDEVAR